MIDEFFVRADIKPRVVAETENVEIIKSMVASGLGVSIVPYQSVAREIRGGTCRWRGSKDRRSCAKPDGRT